MDLQQLVYTFLIVSGAGSVYAGVWLLGPRVVAAMRTWRRGEEASQGTVAAAPGLFLLGLGALLLLSATMLAAGSWRKPEPAPFPIGVMNLNLPPAAIERVPPTAPGS